MDINTYIQNIIEIIKDEDLTDENIMLRTNLTNKQICELNNNINPQDIPNYFNVRLIKVIDKLFELAEEGNNAAISNILKIYGLEYKTMNKDKVDTDNELKISIDWGEVATENK